ncbi:hypothetical protein CYMTET_35443 [Cymbomonas tetramitiformis]|nr:hypothetical protein CYMTET_35443 [Cymbomonas tetramitiformis]
MLLYFEHLPRPKPEAHMSVGDRVYAILAAADPQLFEHLQTLEVYPQLFLLRWMRLLFGREFHLEDCMTLWDCLFSVVSALRSSGGFTQLVEAFAVAMIMFVRVNLLEYSDSSQCLRRLQRFPPVEDVRVLVETAKTLIPLAVAAPRNFKPNASDAPLPAPPSLTSSSTPARRPPPLRPDFQSPLQTAQARGSQAPMSAPPAPSTRRPVAEQDGPIAPAMPPLNPANLNSATVNAVGTMTARMIVKASSNIIGSVNSLLGSVEGEGQGAAAPTPSGEEAAQPVKVPSAANAGSSLWRQPSDVSDVSGSSFSEATLLAEEPAFMEPRFVDPLQAVALPSGQQESPAPFVTALEDYTGNPPEFSKQSPLADEPISGYEVYDLKNAPSLEKLFSDTEEDSESIGADLPHNNPSQPPSNPLDEADAQSMKTMEVLQGMMERWEGRSSSPITKVTVGNNIFALSEDDDADGAAPNDDLFSPNLEPHEEEEPAWASAPRGWGTDRDADFKELTSALGMVKELQERLRSLRE